MNVTVTLNPVEEGRSSQIAKVGYDGPSETLRLEFKAGTRYDYHAVPRSVYEGLLAAESLGKYLHSEIKGKFKYTRIEKE